MLSPTFPVGVSTSGLSVLSSIFKRIWMLSHIFEKDNRISVLYTHYRGSQAWTKPEVTTGVCSEGNTLHSYKACSALCSIDVTKISYKGDNLLLLQGFSGRVMQHDHFVILYNVTGSIKKNPKKSCPISIYAEYLFGHSYLLQYSREIFYHLLCLFVPELCPAFPLLGMWLKGLTSRFIFSTGQVSLLSCLNCCSNRKPLVSYSKCCRIFFLLSTH